MQGTFSETAVNGLARPFQFTDVQYDFSLFNKVIVSSLRSKLDVISPVPELLTFVKCYPALLNKNSFAELTS